MMLAELHRCKVAHAIWHEYYLGKLTIQKRDQKDRRKKALFEIEVTETKRIAKLPKHSIVKSWNKLPTHLKLIEDVNEFIKSLKQHLLEMEIE